MELSGCVGLNFFVHLLDYAVGSRMFDQRSVMLNLTILANLIDSVGVAVFGLVSGGQQIIAEFGTVIDEGFYLLLSWLSALIDAARLCLNFSAHAPARQQGI